MVDSSVAGKSKVFPCQTTDQLLRPATPVQAGGSIENKPTKARVQYQFRDIGKRQVVHYHLKNWNEGNPPEPMNFLKVLKTIRERKFSSMQYEDGDENRVLVHCRDGANCSGGFIAVWKLMDDVDQNQKPNVFATVEKLRHQRMLAVQTPSMYYYVHKCIDLYVENKKIFSEERHGS
ncbi:tyrosine-protein phosphatase non-receptor type 9-like [Hyalella azteca]|uniref:Tyrosine-protein phosphatase non-receptor type 9-like n=1 Tax=Hyalella azteca TaxID=294128 RepID=A0A8B7N1B7_HYAAZ|nr:tyrosine-protein phosphatase non-receptor type 9-like [Hyalella azteca]